jgi:UDP-N-acetylmuramoyl-L-alanyl-D-glutamate--2,6-diaminopimelate ligase
MKLDEAIAADEGVVRGDRGETGAVEITGLAYDSRTVHPGSLFFCVKGFQSDGHDFAAQAVARGAAALVVERPLDLGVPEVLVPSARAAMGPAAVRFYGDPSAELRVIGVTGTNGKTTTAFLLKALLEASGRASGAGGSSAGGGGSADSAGGGGSTDSAAGGGGAAGPAGGGCGLLGTVKTVIGGVERAAGRTTPEAIDLQADFRAMLDGGDWACAMEVSSHALELGRAEGIHFAAAIFTNLTQDHLDFHETMEDYFQAKRRLFVPPAWSAGADAPDKHPSRPSNEYPGVSIVNVGDPYGRRLAGEIDGAVTFAVEDDADYRATDLRCDAVGCHFVLHAPAGEREVALPMPGRFNVANALAALATVHSLGGELDLLVEALQRGVSVPGRMEPVDEGQDFAVLVDYAHTPDSLENVLRAAREIARGRVICVFGAGGDRDRGKRPLMGEIAARLADVVVVTSDNPRSEAPEAIVAEILTGAAGVVQPQAAEPVRAIPDRAQAIADAIGGARQGDVVVIAGKGHEQGQEFADGHRLPFDDVSVARDVLRTHAGVGVRTGARVGARDDIHRIDARAGAGA